MVLVLVLLPPLAGLARRQPARGAARRGDLARRSRMTLAQGRRPSSRSCWSSAGALFPWLLWQVARTGSRELFTLCVIAAAVGIAYGSAALFGVSFALGAFFAGMVMRESELSHRAADESLPLRDAFSVLFFVSVGHAVRPDGAGRASRCACWPWSAIIVLGKSLAAFVLVLALPLSAQHRADGVGQPGADRRVLVHPGRPRRRRSALLPRGRAEPDPGRRADLDRAQSAGVHGDRAAAALDPRALELRAQARAPRRSAGRAADDRRRRRSSPATWCSSATAASAGASREALTRARHPVRRGRAEPRAGRAAARARACRRCPATRPSRRC